MNAVLPATLTQLDGLFRRGGPEEKLEALESARLRRLEWDRRWGGLFLRWARAEDSNVVIANILGPELLGPLWIEGLIAPRQLVALSLWPTVWPWRTGLTALAPSLGSGESDWPLLEQFLKACLGPDSRFHQDRRAFQGVLLALRAARKAAPGRVADFLGRHEPVLPAFVMAGLGPRRPGGEE